MGARVKSVVVHYTLIGDHPNRRKIERVTAHWLSKGYQLQMRQEFKPGGCSRLLTLFLIRGRSELLFTKID